MQEIEVKILEINKQEIINKLEKLGAKIVFEGSIENEFFDNQGKRIRLRKMGGKNFVTFKIKAENDIAKSNLELETEFGDYDTFVNILTNIGFTKTRDSHKTRISYHLGNIGFDIDDFPGIPTFLEIEAQNNDDIIKGLELLGFKLSDSVTYGEMELKKHYNIL